MDDFDDFELTQEELTQLESIEINLLNQSLQIDSDDDEYEVQRTNRRCRRIILSESDDSDTEVARIIADTVGKSF